MTQIKLVGVSMIFHFTIFCLSVTVREFYIRQYVCYKLQPPVLFVFLVFHKSGLINSCSSSEDLPDLFNSLYFLLITPKIVLNENTTNSN
jgi:hypothetical protein